MVLLLFYLGSSFTHISNILQKVSVVEHNTNILNQSLSRLFRDNVRLRGEVVCLNCAQVHTECSSFLTETRYQAEEEHVTDLYSSVRCTLACPKRGSGMGPLPLRPAKEFQ
jgi:hypothetical protein